MGEVVVAVLRRARTRLSSRRRAFQVDYGYQLDLRQLAFVTHVHAGTDAR
jgi:hypothetical protein